MSVRSVRYESRADEPSDLGKGREVGVEEVEKILRGVAPRDSKYWGEVDIILRHESRVAKIDMGRDMSPEWASPRGDLYCTGRERTKEWRFVVRYESRVQKRLGRFALYQLRAWGLSKTAAR